MAREKRRSTFNSTFNVQFNVTLTTGIPSPLNGERAG
jgi:hypothetical protein